jgi:hypothetical protein
MSETGGAPQPQHPPNLPGEELKPAVPPARDGPRVFLLPATPKTDRIALAALIVSLGTGILGIWLAYNANQLVQASNQLVRTQAGVELVSNFATADIARASHSLFNAGVDEAAYTATGGIDGAAEFERDVGPLKSQLYGVAACLDSGLCDQPMTLEVFCDRARVFAAVSSMVYQRLQQGSPSFADFFDRSLERCPSESTP